MSNAERIRLALALLLLGGLVGSIALAWNHTATAGRSGGPPFALRATPTSEHRVRGSQARYAIAIVRGRWSGLVSLAVSNGLPPGARAWLTPRLTRGNSSTLVVATAASTPVGSYVLTLLAHGRGHRSATSMGLRVTTTPDVVGAARVNFAISGSVRDLQPGAPAPLDVAVANPNRATLLLTALTVRVKALRAPGATSARPCTLADFWVGQFSGTYPIAVPPVSTSTLASLGIASSLWPRVLMLDRAVNQDGCMGASLSLAYGGAGTLR